MKYRIVSDSSSDITYLPTPFASVPLKIRAGGCEFVDDEALDVGAMLDHLEHYDGKTTTACPNAGEWEDAFEDAEHVVCVTITSGLSGSCNAARAAANSYLDAHPERKVLVLDTKSVGPESALILERLALLVREEPSFKQLSREIAEYMRITHLLFALESLHNLAANGRVHPLVAKLAGVFGIRIIGQASGDGVLDITNKVRGAAKTVSTLFENMLDAGYAGGRVRIHHAQNPTSAVALERMIRATFPHADVTVAETRGLCSFYAQRGGLLVGYEGREKK